MPRADPKILYFLTFSLLKMLNFAGSFLSRCEVPCREKTLEEQQPCSFLKSLNSFGLCLKKKRYKNYYAKMFIILKIFLNKYMLVEF